MGQRVNVVLDPARSERVSIELPLVFRTAPDALRAEAGFAPWVDLDDPIVLRAVALCAAAARREPQVRFAVFGGVAHRLSCPSSNDPSLGLRHGLHDLDIAVRIKDVREFRRFLSTLAEEEGSGLTFFETPGDRIFNSISGGMRLRWHMVAEQRGSEVVLATLDIVADEFQFCHRFDVREDVERAPGAGWTLSPTHLLLAKGQFIRRIPKGDARLVPDRLLEPFGKHDVLIGPEPKDVQDILALLHDHPVDDSPSGISPSQLGRQLGADWGLWRTVGLTLAMVGRSSIVAGLRPDARERVTERLGAVRRRVASLSPKRRFGFLGGPWWQDVDSTPAVDATAGWVGGPLARGQDR